MRKKGQQHGRRARDHTLHAMSCATGRACGIGIRKSGRSAKTETPRQLRSTDREDGCLRARTQAKAKDSSWMRGSPSSTTTTTGGTRPHLRQHLAVVHQEEQLGDDHAALARLLRHKLGVVELLALLSSHTRTQAHIHAPARTHARTHAHVPHARTYGRAHSDWQVSLQPRGKRTQTASLSLPPSLRVRKRAPAAPPTCAAPRRGCAARLHP